MTIELIQGLPRMITSRGYASRQLVFQQLALQFKAMGRPASSAEQSGGESEGNGQPASAEAGSSLASSSSASAARAGLRSAIDELMQKGSAGELSWLELYDFESMILRVLDDVALRDESWAIREEFRNLASDDLYQAYINSKPPEDPRNPATPADVVRRDVENLLRKLHELRLGRTLLDVIRAYTTALTLIVTLLLILATIVAAFFKPGTKEPPVLLLVVVGGVFGAGLSMLQRLSQIPSKGDLVPRYPAFSRRLVWILTPLLSLSQGALAAIVLYLIFKAGLLTGPMFPMFPVSSGTGTANSTLPVLDQLLHDNLPSVVDAAKLLVWTLVAGTAERLVPDLLSRLSAQASRSALGAAK